VTAQPPAEAKPWYKTPLGMLALGVGGLVGIAAVVAVAKSTE
jgi:hypothetical protein